MSHRGYYWILHDQTDPGFYVPEFQIPNNGYPGPGKVKVEQPRKI